MSDLSHAMQRVIHYYSPNAGEDEGPPRRRQGETNRDRAFLNDVLATAWETSMQEAYQRGYEAALRERGLLKT